MTIDITLLIVAYHPSQNEVLRLKSCLDSLPSNISYAVAVNDYVPADFIDLLELDSEFFLRITENIGYGRAINRLFLEGGIKSEYIGILNTDLSWRVGTFEAIHDFLQNNSDVSLLAPQILGEHGEVHMLCKRSPTVLAMFSRRFLPNSLKPYISGNMIFITVCMSMIIPQFLMFLISVAVVWLLVHLLLNLLAGLMRPTFCIWRTQT